MGQTKPKTNHWGVRAPLFLIKNLNCATASQELFQKMIGREEKGCLNALTGLEGGVVASGSTCGVLTGGALGIALMHDAALQEGGPPAEAGVMALVGEYVRWFEARFGSACCRERSGVDFYTTRGQLRYLFPGDRVGKCLWHIRGAFNHLHGYQEKALPPLDLSVGESGRVRPIHCAQEVLRGVRERTGVGDPLLERLAFIYDGGVGLTGGACGALIGAVMGINLLLGADCRHGGYFQIVKSFVVGHVNLLIDSPFGQPESFAEGRRLVERFREQAGEIACHPITKKRFADWRGFQEHIASSQACAGLIALATTEASAVIKRVAG